MRQTPTILDAFGREARLIPPRPPAPRVPSIAPSAGPVSPAPAQSPSASGWRRALQMVDTVLMVIAALIAVVLVFVGLVWLVGALFGPRDDC